MSCATKPVDKRGTTLVTSNLTKTGDRTYSLNMKNPTTNTAIKAAALKIVKRDAEIKSEGADSPQITPTIQGKRTEIFLSPKAVEAAERVENLGPAKISPTLPPTKKIETPLKPTEDDPKLNIISASIVEGAMAKNKPIGLWLYYAIVIFIILAVYSCGKFIEKSQAFSFNKPKNPFIDKDKKEYLGDNI